MQVLTRSEQKTMDTWDLGSLFENDAAWEAAVEELRSFIKEIPSYKGSLKAGRESLLKTMAFHAKVGILAERVSSYALSTGRATPRIRPTSNAPQSPAP